MRIQKLLVPIFVALTVALVTGYVSAQESRSSENPFAAAIEKIERERQKTEARSPAAQRSAPPREETTLRCIAGERQCTCMGGADSGDCRVMNAFLCVGEDRYTRMKCDENGQCSCRTRASRGDQEVRG